MLACVSEASAAYQVPVPAIQRVLSAAADQGSAGKGVGPMGIPAAWMPVLKTYGFSLHDVRADPCWGIAAGTWILAVESLYSRSSGGAPMYPTHLGNIPKRYVHWANAASAATGVPAAMILAVAAQESGFDPDAVSPAGAEGLMQFIPGTWSNYGHGSPFNPQDAMMAGALYLRHLALEFKSWPLALAGYNAGGQAVRNAGYQIPPFRQTQNYVPSVLGYYQQIVSMQKR